MPEKNESSIGFEAALTSTHRIQRRPDVLVVDGEVGDVARGLPVAEAATVLAQVEGEEAGPRDVQNRASRFWKK